MKAHIAPLIIWGGLVAVSATAQQPELDREQATRIIETVLDAFAEHYLYPETSARMADHVRDRLQDGAYEDCTDRVCLTGRLIEDLRSISQDRHIWIAELRDDSPPPEPDAAVIARRARRNFSFGRVERLKGNVGYLKFDRFEDPAYAGETAVAAMNLLAYCDAVILDLRENHGGEEKMVKLLSSYFYAEPRLINSLYFPRADSLRQSWTYAHVPGPRLDGVDLYILTSEETASGAEAFSYSMKHHGRATLIGETTRGAAHWTDNFDFPEVRLRVSIPVARPINPITQTSWEGTGVTPNIAVPAAEALTVAHREALKRVR